MKKIFILLLGLSLVWMVKLSYDVFTLNTQQTELSNTLHRIEQSNANLNDQMVSLQRHMNVKDGTVNPAAETAAHLKIISESSIDPIVVIKQQVDLIEFMLKQQKTNEALERLMLLERNIEQYALAPSLKQSLHEVIKKDQQVIQQFASARIAQQTKINVLIHQLDQALAEEIMYPQLKTNTSQREYFWQRWLVIESAKQPATALIQRPLILKEAQLRLLLAQHAVQQGQYLEYQQALTEIISLLNALPDEKTHQMIQKIQKIKGLSVIPTPILNTRELLG